MTRAHRSLGAPIGCLLVLTGTALGLAGCSAPPKESTSAPGFVSATTTVPRKPFTMAQATSHGPTTLPEGYFDPTSNTAPPPATTTVPETTTTVFIPDPRVSDPARNDPLCISAQTIMDGTLKIRDVGSPEKIPAAALALADSVERSIALIAGADPTFVERDALVEVLQRFVAGLRSAKTMDDVLAVGSMLENPSGADAAALQGFDRYLTNSCPPPGVASPTTPSG